jgi:DNA-3-methyladenine glycosylase
LAVKKSNYRKLRKEFYLQGCLAAAKGLIGKVLVRKKGRKLYSGIIVETEAYLGSRDAASHSYRGRTKRNEYMFSEGGRAYVYFTYGNHYCVNAVIGKEGLAHAVLIRAVEPVVGITHMIKNRGTNDVHNLTSGPGKLTEAMEIDGKLNGTSLLGDELFIAESGLEEKQKIVRSKRIGITKNPDKLYRFYAEGNKFVSGKRT